MISVECVIFIEKILLILKILSQVVQKTSDIFGADPRKLYF